MVVPFGIPISEYTKVGIVILFCSGRSNGCDFNSVECLFMNYFTYGYLLHWNVYSDTFAKILIRLFSFLLVS